MSEELLIKHCSPTLAGLKTANIFSCEYHSAEELREELCRLNRILAKKGIRVIPLKKSKTRVLIYAYRPEKLKRDISSTEADRILSQNGYNCACIGGCVRRLANRMTEEGEFPHEIGFFLGYPPEDVVGFIENNAQNYKCKGCWKVYGDEEKARRLFAGYKKCTDVYLRKYSLGNSLERLAVGIR